MTNGPSLPPTDRSIRILLVERNAAFTRRIMHVLQEWSETLVVVRVAWNDGQLLPRSKELQPDVILIDLTVADLSWLQSIAALRAKLPEAGIVALTALGLDGYAQAVIATGADVLVSKTAIRTDLLAAVRLLVQNKALPDRSAATAGHSGSKTR